MFLAMLCKVFFVLPYISVGTPRWLLEGDVTANALMGDDVMTRSWTRMMMNMTIVIVLMIFIFLFSCAVIRMITMAKRMKSG